MKKREFITACSFLVFLVASLAQGAELKLVQSADQVTRTEEGGGARPEIFYRSGQFNLVYRDTYVKAAGSFRLKVLDKNLQPTGVQKILVTSDGFGGVTDIRLAYDSSFIYMAYEKVSPEGRSLFLEKQDTSFNRLASKQVASAGLPGKGTEALDDPGVVLGKNQVYVLTKIGFGKEDKRFRIRGFDRNLSLTFGPQDVNAGVNLDLGHIPSALFQKDSFYLVTAVHVSGRPLCPQADATTNNDLFALQFRSDWTYMGTKKQLTNAPHIEYYPTGLKYSDGKYFVTYLVNDAESYLPHCGRGGNLGIGTVMLKVFDSAWNPWVETKVTGSGELANHPTVEVVGNQIYVAYGQKEGAGLGEGSSNLKIKVFEFRE
jgi:hypothetical protein